MIRRFIIAAALLAAALPLPAQQENSSRDRTLEEMEAKLQEQRATAVRTRLVLYSDELEKLHTQYTAAGDTAAVTAVKAEMDAVQLAMRQLAGIARRQNDPAAPEEVKKDEEISAAALAARRINKIVERFNVAKTAARPAVGAAAGARAQTLNLKVDKAARKSDYADIGSRTYWGYEGVYAHWSLPNLAQGEYEIIFRYNADSETGGKAVVKIGTARLEVTVPPGVKGSEKKEQRLTAGTVTVKEQGVDLRVESAGLTKGSQSLWMLEAVTVQPAAKRP